MRVIHCRCGRPVECQDIRNPCTCGREYNLSGRRVDEGRHQEDEHWLHLQYEWPWPINMEVPG